MNNITMWLLSVIGMILVCAILYAIVSLINGKDDDTFEQERMDKIMQTGEYKDSIYYEYENEVRENFRKAKEQEGEE